VQAVAAQDWLQQVDLIEEAEVGSNGKLRQETCIGSFAFKRVTVGIE